MIPNHAQFIQAIADRKKNWVKFYSKPDAGVLEQAYAPMEYGAGNIADGLNRSWLWDHTSTTGSHATGLLPQQIVDLKVLGETFDPATFAAEFLPTPIVSKQASAVSAAAQSARVETVKPS